MTTKSLPHLWSVKPRLRTLRQGPLKVRPRTALVQVVLTDGSPLAPYPSLLVNPRDSLVPDSIPCYEHVQNETNREEIPLGIL